MSDTINSYPSIYALGHKALGEEFLDRELIVQEKVDGSQFSAMWTGNGWAYRSKGVQVHKEDAPDLFRPTIAHFEKNGWLAVGCPAGLTFRGEAFKKEKHNTLKYGRIPKGHLVLFDVELPGQNYATPEQVVRYAEYYGLEPIRTIFVGRVTLDMIQGWLNEESALGGTKVEGVVLKPASYDLFGPDKKLLIAKMVRPEFKEENGAAWKIANPGRGDVVDGLIQRYRSEPRWKKAVQHLRDAGKLTGTPQDIGPLLAEIKRDIEKEESDEIARVLLNRFLPDILRGATGGAPEWYKNELAGLNEKESIDDRVSAVAKWSADKAANVEENSTT